MRHIVLLMCGALAITGCSRDLSEDQAMKQISEAIPPITGGIQLGTLPAKAYKKGLSSDPADAPAAALGADSKNRYDGRLYEQAVTKGFITIELSARDPVVGGPEDKVIGWELEFEVKPTKMGQEYFTKDGRAILSNRVISEVVLGSPQSETRREVYYSWRERATPIGKLTADWERRFDSGSNSRTAVFELRDGEWQLVSMGRRIW
jgi:hypothetical protein